MSVNWPDKSGRKARKIKKLTAKSTRIQTKRSRDKGDAPNPGPLLKKPWKTEEKFSPMYIIFIPNTPHGMLRAFLQKTDNDMSADCKFSQVKVVETLSPKLNEPLSNEIFWSKAHCDRENCVRCATKPGTFRARNCTNRPESQVKNCKHVYYGEICIAWFDRARYYIDKIKTQDQDNPIIKHQTIHHYKFKLDRRWHPNI